MSQEEDNRSRSRSRDRSPSNNNDERSINRDNSNNADDQEEATVYNLYVSNLSFEVSRINSCYLNNIYNK